MPRAETCWWTKALLAPSSHCNILYSKRHSCEFWGSSGIAWNTKRRWVGVQLERGIHQNYRPPLYEGKSLLLVQYAVQYEDTSHNYQNLSATKPIHPFLHSNLLIVLPYQIQPKEKMSCLLFVPNCSEC